MSNQVVVTITDNKIVAEQIDTMADDPVVLRTAVSWKPGILSESFEELLNQMPRVGHIRILLTETLYHIAGFTIQKDKTNNREQIQQKASEFFLEDLDMVRWDYVVLRVSGDEAFVQVVCLNKRFDKEITKLQAGLKIRVEAMLPASFVLMNSFEERDATFILVYADDVIKVISVVKDGLVLFTTDFTLETVADKFKRTVEYAQKYLEFDFRKVVISGLSKSAVSNNFKEVVAIEAEISAAANFADQTKFTGADKKILNLATRESVLEVDEFENSTATQAVTRENIPQNKFLYMLLAVSLLGIVAGYFIIRLLNN